MSEKSEGRTIPLEEAVAVLSRIAASDPGPSDAVGMHLRAARALDELAARGFPVPAERFVPALAGLSEDPSASVLDLLITLLEQSPETATAIVQRARELAETATTVDPEAARAAAARRVLLDPALEIGRYLSREVALSNEFRREELVRTWADRVGLPLRVRGKLEPEERSRRTLDRLDYRKIKADEDRLAIERRVLAEHAEKVREKQRQREAEALASAQRE
jgi:hypothetical protein